MGIGDFEDIKLTIRASDFIRSELPSCDLEVIENASENYDLKSVKNRLTNLKEEKVIVSEEI